MWARRRNGSMSRRIGLRRPLRLGSGTFTRSIYLGARSSQGVETRRCECARSLVGRRDRQVPATRLLRYRGDNYKNTYGAGPHPKRPVKDTKYGVCFRGCLAFVPSFIASELKLAGQGALAELTRIDFALEGGHANVGDARRLFELYKKDALPEWQHLIGEFDTSTKDSVGAQAADFLAYAVYRAELLEHGQAASDIETPSYVADAPMIANNYPRAPVPQSGPMLFRNPITRDVLQSLKDNLFAIEAERRVRTAP